MKPLLVNLAIRRNHWLGIGLKPPPGEGIPAEEYHAFWRWVRAFNDKPVGHLMSVTKRRPLVKRPPLPKRRINEKEDRR